MMKNQLVEENYHFHLKLQSLIVEKLYFDKIHLKFLKIQLEYYFHLSCKYFFSLNL